MTRKLDFLGECNDQKLPLEDFRLTFCVRCFQRDCTRSQFGLSRFEARVASWQERLFNAPQLPKNDPRYPAIIAKKFLGLSVPISVQSRQEWVDPQTLDTPSLPAQTTTQVKDEPIRVEPPKLPDLPPEQPKPIPVRPNLLMNTPHVEPRMLQNNASPTQPRDAWAAPESPKSIEGVVKPGARIKIGGSG